jgi:tyrosinase
VPSALAQTSYDNFSSPINGIHGGAYMGWRNHGHFDSPADPVFWLHHANLDRLWWVWVTVLWAIIRTQS